MISYLILVLVLWNVIFFSFNLFFNLFCLVERAKFMILNNNYIQEAVILSDIEKSSRNGIRWKIWLRYLF